MIATLIFMLDLIIVLMKIPVVEQKQDAVIAITLPSPKVAHSRMHTRKRKRGAEFEECPNEANNSRGKKTQTKYDGDLDLETGVNNAFSTMNSQLLADYLAQRTKRFESELSVVELEDRYIPASLIRDTTRWNKPRDLNNLPGFLEMFSGNSTKLWSASKKNGAPHTIIVTAAGLRAADLARSVRDFQTKDVKVAKLFAKHIKIQDAIKFLKSTRTGLAVGTPQRLKDLIDEGALQLDRLERIIIDASHIDQKKRGLLDMKESHVPLTLLLGQKELRDRWMTPVDSLELLFY